MRRLLLLMLVGSCLHRAGAIVIEGQVLMPDGSPASGATVQPRGVDDQPPSEPPLACDALGRFTLGPDVPGARWTKLVAWADAGCAVGVGDQRRGPLLVLRPWRSVAGQVVTADGRPLAHVRVAVDKMTFLERYTYADVAVDDHCWPGAVTSTDEQGRWRLDRVPPWPASIRFRHEQYAEVTRDASFEGLRRLVLPPGGAVAGRVTDPTGHPLPGLTVFAADYYDQDLRSECVTDAAGCYRISGLRRGAALVGLAADGPLVAKTRKVDPIEEGVTTSDVDLVALAGQWLTLTVTDGPGGPPVAGLRANCSLPQGGRHTMVTDARGQGHVRALRGQVYVSSGDTQWHGKPGLTARFSVLGGRPEQSATVALQRPSWLDVRVVGFDGSPQRGAYVAVPRTGARDSTDDEGWIRLPRAAVPRGAALRIWLPGAGGLGFGHEVTAEELGLGRAVVKAPHPEQPRLAIWGRVVDDAGQPIAECQVSMLSTRADGLMASGYQRTDEHGNYRFDGDQAPLAQASVSLSAADYEHRSTELAPRQLTAPTALPDMVLPPPPSGQVSGRVVDSRGRAVVRVYVTASSGQTDYVCDWGDRKFTVTGLPSGPVRLSAGQGAEWGEVAAEAGQTGVLLRLRPIRLAAEGEGRELVPQLLRAALARSTTAEWPDRPLVPGLMMRYDAALGQDMLSGLADAGDAATLAASLVDCLERLPQAAVESLTLIDRLSEPLRSRTRLLGAMALLDGPAADRAEVLLDAVPVSDTSPADLRVLHGFVAARLGRPAGLALLRAALDDLGGDTRAWAETLAWRAAGRDDILAALGLLMPDGQPDPRYRLASALGLARQQPLSAAEPLLAALAVHPQWSTTHWRDYGETPFERALSSQYLRTEHVQELQCAVTRLMLDLPLPQARRLVDRWPDYLRPAARLLLATRAAPAELNQAVDRDMADWPPTALLPLAVGVAPSVGPSYVWRAMAETRRRNQLMFQSPETIAYMAHQPAGLVALAMMQPGSCRAGIWEFGRRWWCALAMVDPYGAARKALDTGRPGADRAQGEDLVDVAEVLALSGRYRLTRYWANEAQLSPLALAVTRPAD